MENGPFIGDLPIQIHSEFHNYVSLPEGKMDDLVPPL